MNIKLTGRLLAAALMSLTAAGCQGEEPQTPANDALSTQEAKAEQSCIEGFNGIKNCATGRAALKSDGKAIAVFGLNNVKEDGVSSSFAKATSWEMAVDIGGLGEKKQGFALAASDGEQVVSTLHVGVGDNDEVRLTPHFTGTPGGSAYRVNLYQGNSLMHSQIYQPDYSVGSHWYNVHIRLDRSLFGFKNHNTSNWPYNATGDGACVWTFRGAPQAFSIDVDGKPVSGDYLEIAEEIGDGHYPYTGFTGIAVTAAAKDFTILGESTTAAK